MNLLVLITLLLELVIMNLNAMKGHTEFWGSPLVLYCTICNIPLTKLKFTCFVSYDPVLLHIKLVHFGVDNHHSVVITFLVFVKAF